MKKRCIAIAKELFFEDVLIKTTIRLVILYKHLVFTKKTIENIVKTAKIGTFASP
jgi:hypothetical protein